MRTKNLFKRLNSGSFLRKVGSILMGTALIASTNLSTAALADNQGGRGAAFEQFRIENPGVDNKELRQMFKQEWRQINGAGNGGGGGHESVVNIQNQAIQNVNNNHLDRNDFASKAEWQAAKQQLKLEQRNINDTINQTVQQGINNHVVNVNAGFALDLTSAVQSITLGDKLFKSQESVTINIGGQEKTLSAGSKVTAAEYVAAKQAMGGAQTVTLDADGRATGGSVDLSAMTAGNKTMKVTDLTVPVAVTASGDFGKGGDVKITGDLTNSGSINAYSSNGKVDALIKADNITNNAGASIVSSVSDLTLRADNSLNNFGDISATGNLTLSAGNSLTNSGNVNVDKNLNVLSPNVTNSGNLASANGNITFDTPVPAAMNINNTNGTVSALNGAINVRDAGYNAAFNTVVNGGDWLSQTMNVNSGNGTTDMNVNNVTGLVTSSGYATHFDAATDNLVIGNIDLVDPTFKNSAGSILINGNISVSDDLTFIARDNITVSSNVVITADNTGAGNGITFIAGANVAAGPTDSPTVNGVTGTPSAATIDGTIVNSAAGGNITFGSNTQVNATSAGGSGFAGGNVRLIALQGTGLGNGNITADGLTITTTGDTAAGNVEIFAGGTGAKTIGSINTNNAAGADGSVTILSTQAVNSGVGNITYALTGEQTSPNGFVGTGPLTAGTITLSGTINSGSADTVIRAGGALTLNGNTSGDDVTVQAAGGAITGTGSITSAGIADVTGVAIISTGTISGASVNLTATNGNIGSSAAARVNTATADLDMSVAGVGTSIFASNTGNLTNLTAVVPATTGTINVTNAGSMSVNNSLTANIIALTTTGVGNGIDVATGVTVAGGGANNIVSVNGAGSITTTGTGLVTGNTINLVSGANIGTSSVSRFRTDANTLTLNAAAGSAFVSDANAVSIGASSVLTDLFVNQLASGDLTVTGTLNATGAINLANFATGTGNINVNAVVGSGATTSVTMTAEDALSTTAAINGQTISLNAVDPSTGVVTLGAAVGSAATTSTTIAAGSTITNAGAILGGTINISTINGNIVFTGNVGNASTTNATITANSNITGTGIISGTTTTITSATGSVGDLSGNVRLRTTAGTLNVNATNANQSIYIQETDAVTLNADVDNATGIIDVLSGGTMTIGSATTGMNVFLSTTGATSNIAVNNALTAGSQMNLSAGGSIVGNALVTSPILTLSATAGNIGTSLANRLNTAAGDLTVTANAATASNGNAWINETDGVVIVSSSVNKEYALTAAGLIDVSGAVTGNNILLTATGGTGSIALGSASTITGAGTSTISLNAAQSITGSNTGTFGKLTGTNVNLVATAGNIGAAGTPIRTAATNISATAGGNIHISEDDAAVITNLSGGAAGTVNLTTLAAGNLTLSGAVSGDAVSVSTFAGGNGNIIVNNTVNGNTSVALSADGSITGASTITAPTVNLTATNGSIGTNATTRVSTASTNLTANAANGSVFINEAGGTTLGASSASSGGTFQLSTVGAGDLIVNSDLSSANVLFTVGSGNFTVGNGFTVGSAGVSTTNINASGNISTGALAGGGSIAGNAVTLTAGGTVGTNNTTNRLDLQANTLTVAGSNIWVTDVGGLNLNTTTTAGALEVSSSGTININGALNGSVIVLDATGAGSDIAGASTVTASTSATYTAANSITATGNITSPTVSLTATAGSIGQNAGTRVRTTAGTLTANAANGDVFINEQDGVTLNASGAATGAGQFILNTLNAGTLSVNGAITGDNIQLTTTGNGSNISTTATGSIGNIATTSNVVLAAGGSITTNALANGISGNTVTLTATGGNIGTSAAARAFTNADTLLLTANSAAAGQGNVWVTEADSVSIQNSSANKEFRVSTTAGSMTVDGTVAGNNIQLVVGGAGNTLSVNNSINGSGISTVGLTSTGSINGNGLISGTDVSLTSTTGSIGVSAVNHVNVSAGTLALSAVAGSAFIEEANAVTLNASTVLNQLLVRTAAAGNITVNGALNATAASGDVQLSTFAGGGGGIVLNAGITGGSTSNGITLLADGSISGAGVLTAFTTNLTSTAGSIGTNAVRVNANSTNMGLNAASGNVFVNNTSAAANVNLSASSGGQFEVTRTNAGDLTLIGTLTGTNVLLRNTSAGNGSILLGANTVTGLGGNNATTVALQAAGTGAVTSTGVIQTGTLNASSGTGNISVSNTNAAALSANTGGAGTVNITDTNATNVNLNGSSAGGAFTLANTAGGNIAINGNVNAAAITLVTSTVGAGSITRNGGSTLVASGLVTLNALGDVGSAGAPVLTNAGSLSVSAGAGRSAFISESSALSSVVTTGGSFATFDLTAGGAITLGNITATTVNLDTTNGGAMTRTAGTTITASNLNLSSDFGNIGATGVANNITTTATNIAAQTSGNVFVNSTNAGTVNFGVVSGSTVGLQTTGNMNLTQNVTGATSVTLTTLGGSDVTQVAGRVIDTATLTLVGANGDFGTSVNNLNTTATSLNANTTTNVFVHSSSSINLVGANTANQFSLISDGDLAQSAGSTLDAEIVLFQTTNNGNITQVDIDGTGAGNATTVTLIAHGSGNIIQSGALDILTDTLVLVSGSGNIGQSGNSILTNATNFSANTSGDVFLSNTNGGAVNLLASSGNAFNLVAADDLNINGALNVGSATISSTADDIVVNAPINASTSIVLAVSAGQTISNTATGSITSGTSTALNASTGAVTIGGVITAGTNVNIVTTSGAQNLNSAINADTVNLIATSATIDLNSQITGTTAINIGVTTGQVNGNGISSLLSTNTLNMSATTGGLGDGGSIFTNAANISAATTGLGTAASDVDITATRTGVINLINLAGNDVVVTATGVGSTMSVGTVNSGGDANFVAGAATNGSIVLNNNIAATDLVTLSANGVGTITRTGGVVTTNVLNMSSGSGDIGSLANRIQTNATTMSASTSGNVFINEANAVGIDDSVAGGFNLTAGGTVTINAGEVLQSTNTTIQAGSIVNDGIIRGIGVAGTRANSVSLIANGAGTITRNGATDVINTFALSLQSSTGNIGALGTAILTDATSLTASTTGNVFVSDSSTTTVSLNGVSGNIVNVALTNAGTNLSVANAVTGTTSITLATAGLGNITRTGAGSVLTAPTVVLTAAGIGSVGSRVLTSADVLFASATAGDAFIAEVDGVTLGTTSSATGQFNMTAGGNLSVNNLTGGTAVTLATTNGGSIISNGITTITTPVLSVTSDSGLINVLTTAGSVSGSTANDISIASSNTALSVGAVTGAAVFLGSQGSLNLLQNVNGINSVTLSGVGAGNISQTVGRTINTPSLTVSTGSGNIGNGGTLLTNAGQLVANTAGNVNITDTFAGPVLLNGMSGNTVTVTTTGANNSLVVNNVIAATNVNLATGAGTNGSIIINGNVNGDSLTGVVNLTADGTGNITNPAGVVTAGTVNLSSTFGNIGTFAKYVQIDAGNMTVNTSGNVYVNNTQFGGIALGTSTGNSFNVTFNSDLTVGGSGIFGNIVNLTANGGTNAGVILANTLGSSSITGTVSVAIHADGSGTISQLFGPTTLINTPTVTLTSGSGDIGSLSNPIYINATNVTATTTGGIYLSNINTGTVNLGPATGTDFFYQNNGSINVVGVLDFSNNVTLITTNNGSINVNAGIIADNTLTLTAGGIGNITQATGTLLDTSNLIATSGGGNIGSLANPLTTNAPQMTVNTGGLGSAWVNNINAGLVVLNGQNGAGQTFNLTVAGSVTTAAGPANFVQANTANITAANGDIGQGVLNPLVTNVGNFSATALNGDVTVQDNDSMNVTGVTAGGNVVIAANNNLSTSGAITGGTEVVLAALNGALDINAAVSAVSQIGLLSGNDLNTGDLGTAGIDASTIAFVSLNGNINLALDNINAPSLTNAAFDADQGSVTVTATSSTLNLQDVTFASLAPLGPGLSTATNQSNGYNVSNAGNINVVDSVDGGSGALQLSTSNNGVITVTATGSTNTAGQTNLFGQGGVAVLNGGSVTSTGSNISISGAGVSISGTVSATDSTFGSVSLQSTAGDVLLGATSSVTANQSTGNALTVSSTNNVDFNGNIDAVGSIDVQATLNFSAGLGSTTDSTAGSITVNAIGTSTVAGSITANTTVGITSVGTNTVSGNVSGTTVSITSSGADLQISGNLTGSTAINLSSNDDLLNANILGGTFTTPQFNLTSTAGSIGANGDALDLNAGVNVNDPLSMTANAFTDVYVTYDGSALTIGGGKSSANGVFDVVNTVGSITTTGDIDPTVVNITSATSIDINSVVSASDAINLLAGTDINTDAVLGSLQTPGTLTATSTGGDIGTNALRLNTQVGTIALSAVAGEAYVDNTNSNLTVNASTALGDLCIDTEGTMTVAGTVTANAISLLATTASVSLQGDVLVQAALNTTGVDTIVDIDADRDIITSGLGTISANLISGTAGRDITIGASVTGDNSGVHSALSTVTFSTTGGDFTSNATVSGNQVDISAETIQLNALVSGTGTGNVVSLTAENSLTAANINGQISAETLNLTSTTGDIGASGAEILTAVQNLSMNAAAGSAYAINNGDVNLLASSVNGTLYLATSGSFLGGAITVTGAVSGFDVVLAAQNGSLFGNLNLNATVTANNNLDLDADNDVTSNASGVLQGRFVNINGVNSVTLNAAVTSTGPANTLDILSTGAIATNAGAVLSGATINVQSTNSTVVIGDDVTGAGAGSVVTITASGASANGSVTTNAGADITGHTITVTSTNDSLVLNGTIDSTGAVGNSVSLSAFNNITAANVANVSAESLSLTSTNGSVGTDFSGGEIVIAGVTNLTVNAAVDSFIRINSDINLVGTNVVVGNFSFGGGTTGGSIDVTGTVNAGQFNTSLGGTNGGDLTISSTGSVTAGAMNLFTFSGTGANGDVTVSGVLDSTNGISFSADGDVTTTGLAFIEADFISFTAANIDVTTKANGASVIATGATGATIVNQGNFNLQGATVTNTLDVSTDATVGGDITVSGVSTADVLNLTANSGTLPANGDIILDASITGTTSVTLTADGGIQDNTNTIGGASVTLNASGGNIVANLSNGAAAQSVTINAGTFDSTINYTGTNTLTMLASSGDQLTLTTTGTGLGAGASFAIGGDSTFNGDIDITTNNMTNAANVLTSTTGDINIQSFAGSGLTLNGGVDPTGGSYSAGGAINITATANNLVLNGTSTYLTSANLFGNGPGQAVVNNGNQVTAAASFVFTANNLGVGTYTTIPPNGSWNFVNSGTYANSDINGDVNFSGDLTFSGSNLAIIAAGDINFNVGGLNIFLNGTTGGNLTMIAGYNFDPATGGQVFNNTGTIFQNFQNTGTGSITGGVNINTSGTSGDGGNVLAIANGGSINIGSIVTTSTFANGGAVTLIGSTGVSVGNIVTTGTSSDGNVTLAVATSSIPTGTGFQVQNGTVITGLGSVAVGSITNGDLVAGNINAGAADVTVYGASLAGNQLDISNGVTADSLTINTVNGFVTANTTVNTLNSNSTGTAAVTLSNSQALTLGTVTGANQSMNLTVSGAFNSSSAFTVNGFTVSADSINLTSGTGTSTNGASLTSDAGDITGAFNTGSTLLTLDAAGTIGVNPGGRFTTDAADMTVDATTSAFIDNTSATGVSFNSGTIGSVFDLLSANSVTTGPANAITAADVVINVTAGDIGATGLANNFRVTNGANPMNLTVTLASTGNAFVDYQGSNALTLGGSTGGSLELTTSNAAGSVVTGADSTFENDITVTTNAMTNANTITSNNGNIIVQSNAGSGLTLTGAPGPLPNTGTFTATNGTISIIATANDLVLDGIMTYTTTASLVANGAGQSVITNVGSNSIALVNSFILTSNLVNNGTLTTLGGTWNVVNSATYANNTGNLTVSGTFNLAGADLAFVSSGDVDLSGATFNLSDTNGGNLTLMAGFNFDPAGTNVQNDITTTLTNFVANGTGGDITTGTINLNGTGGAGGNLIALANLGSVSLGNVTSTGTTNGGDITVIASNGITTGSIDVSGPTGGDVSLISGNPTVGASFTILAGAITAGANTIASTGLTGGAINVGTVNVGNGSFSAQTTNAGSITAAAGISAHDITLQTGTLTLTTVSNLTSSVDAGGNAGSIIVSATTVDTAAVGDRLTFVANGTGNGDGGVIDFTLNNAAAVTLGPTGTYEFQATGAGTGDGGSMSFSSLGNVTLAANSFVGTGGTDGGEAHVNTTGSITVADGAAFNLVGANGKGAEIELEADGTLALGANIGFFTGATSQANGTGANGDGGSIIFSAANITFTGAGTSAAAPLALSAHGVGNGDAGEIIWKNNAATATFVGNPAKAPKAPFMFLTADASAGASGSGNGGNLVIEVGGNLTISDTSLVTAAHGSTGTMNGASYTFKAGQVTTGALLINGAGALGSIDASGANGGDGGIVNLSSRSTNVFSVNKANPKNGIVGTVTAAGNNGEINITNFAGGILVQTTAGLTSPEMSFAMGGSKGSFTVGAGTVINASNLLTFQGSGGSIGGRTLINVNTSTLQVNTAGSGAVGINNLNTGGTLVLDSSSGGSFTLVTNGSTTLNDINTGAKGNITITENGGALVVNNGSTITANNGALVLQNTNPTGTIAIGDNATVQTLGTQGKSVRIVIGAVLPTTGTNPFPPAPANVNVTITNPKNFVWFGTPGVVVGPGVGSAQVTSKNQNVLFSGTVAGSISLGNGSLVLADPPDRVSASSAVPSVAAAIPAASSKSIDLAPIFGFASEQSTSTSDLSVLNLNAAPQLQAANNSTLMTATNTASLAAQAGMTVSNGAVNTGMSGLASVVRTSSVTTADEDNSYMVGFMGNSVGETEAAICSDAEIGITEEAERGGAVHAPIQRVQHSERVVIKKGNVLFVPFKATTVETPNGIVHIDAKSVALVSSTDAGLAVYDLEDQHKGSVSVESNGHNVVLSPGRHVMVTKHHTAEFAQINAVETIAHRNVQSTVKNGHRAHTSEFSVLTAMDTVKPLKALAMSKHANAKHIADRMLKTTAIILQIGGASGQYQHYFKPRMTAMQK